MRRILTFAPLAFALLALTSCTGAIREGLPAAPTAANPAGGRPITLRGNVLDTAFRALRGARVEVMDGPSAGLSAVADESGITLTGMFTKETVFRATFDQHESRIQPWNCSVEVCGNGGANPWLAFYLKPVGPSVDIAGEYTLTIVADAACADIPPERRVRVYRASVSPQPAAGRPGLNGFELHVTDDSMIGRYRGFTIGAAGTYLGLWLHGGHDPVIVERIEGHETISVSGAANSTVAGTQPPVITAALDGWIEYHSPQGATFTCTSTAHQIILKRL